jgi:tetratricopeptide (TPR) repeat protein
MDLLGEVSLDVVRIQLICEYYDEVVDFEKLIKRQIEKFDVVTKQKIVFNIAIAYDGLKKYEQALVYYEMLEDIVTEPDKIFHLKNMKALCLEGLHRYDEAISLYRSALLKYSDIEKKLIASANLMYIAQMQDNRERCKFYLRKNKQLLEEIEGNSSIELQYIERVYYSMAEAAEYLNRNKEATEYYYKVFTDMDNVSITNMRFKYLSMGRLLKISDNCDIKNIKKLEKIYFTLLSEKANLMLGYKFVNYYNTYNFKEHLDSFLKRMLDYKEEEI